MEFFFHLTTLNYPRSKKKKTLNYPVYDLTFGKFLIILTCDENIFLHLYQPYSSIRVENNQVVYLNIYAQCAPIPSRSLDSRTCRLYHVSNKILFYTSDVLEHF